MENNSENRNANISSRGCSFCRRLEHNINNCNDIRLRVNISRRNRNRLIDFDILCNNNIELSIRNQNNPRQKLLDLLLEYSIHNSSLIRYIASIYLGVSITNLNIVDIVYDLHNYYCLIYSIPYSRYIPNEDLFENLINTQNNKRLNITTNTKLIENSNN